MVIILFQLLEKGSAISFLGFKNSKETERFNGHERHDRNHSKNSESILQNELTLVDCLIIERGVVINAKRVTDEHRQKETTRKSSGRNARGIESDAYINFADEER